MSKYPLLPVVLIWALLILVLELSTGLFTRWSDPSRDSSHYAHFVNDENWLSVRIADMPQHRGSTVSIVADVKEIGDSTGLFHESTGKILLYVEKDAISERLQYGDQLTLLASPRLPSANDNPHQFDYRKHLARKGILYTAYVPSGSYRLSGHDCGGVMGSITKLRQNIAGTIHLSNLSSSQQGIAEALILGWDDDLDEETEQQFRSAGITHLLCVSGLHVGIVAMLVGYCLFSLGNSKRQRVIRGIVQLLAIWFFVLLTGMAPGTTRAGIMFTFIIVGQIFFTRPPTLNVIAASALVMLAFKPLLLFDVGFQLSYAAVTAIVLLVPPLVTLIPVRFKGNLITDLALKTYSLFCVSLVAQLAVMPFTLFYFHQFPVYFLVANMVVIPFAGAIIGTVILMVAVCWWPAVFALVGSAVQFEIAFVERVTSTIAGWPHATLQNIYFDSFMFIVALAIVLAIGWLVLRRRWPALASALVLCIVMTFYSRHVEAKCSMQRQFDVYRVGNRTAIEFFAGHKSYLICDSATASNPQKIDFQTTNNLIWHKTRERNVFRLDTTFCDENIMLVNEFISFNGHTMRIIDRSNFRHQSEQRVRVNYLLLRESPYITVEELSKQYSFDTLIITSQNSVRRRDAWIEQCKDKGIAYKNLK